METTNTIKNIFGKAFSCHPHHSDYKNGEKSNYLSPRATEIAGSKRQSTISGLFLDALYHYLHGEVFITSDYPFTITLSEGGNRYIYAQESLVSNDIEVLGSKGMHWSYYIYPLHFTLSGYYSLEDINWIREEVKRDGMIKKSEGSTYPFKFCDDLYFVGKRDFSNDLRVGYDEHLDSVIKPEADVQKTEEPMKRTRKAKSTKTKDIDYSPYSIDLGRKMSKEEKLKVPQLKLGTDIIVPEYVLDHANIIKGEIEGKSPINNILWYGPAGTGKSFNTKILAQLFNLPHYQFIFSKGIDEVSMVAGADISEGTVSYNESNIVQCARNGGVIEFQEFYNAQPSVISFLNELMEEGFLRLANGEVIKRHPKCIIVATSNISYAGCQSIDFSTDDRFRLQEDITDIEDDVLLQRIKYSSGNEDESLISNMVKAYRDIKKVLDEEEWDEGVVSIRKLTSWAQACKYDKNIIKQAERTVLSGISKSAEKRKEIIDNYLLHIFR